MMPDLYGISGPNEFKGPSCGDQLGDLILARKLYAYGEENDYFDYSTCIGWVRRGTWDRKDGCAVVMSNAGPGEKRMFVGKEHIGEIWTDLVCHPPYRAHNNSWAGVMRKLKLEEMASDLLFVGNAPLASLSIRLQKTETYLGSGITLTI